MGHLLPDHDDQVLLERDTLDGGIRVSAEKLEAFGRQLETRLVAMEQKWQPYAAPRAVLAQRRVHYRS